ncbi:MAG: pilus assembly protein PilM [Candidatus Ratteibacteria bacterium]|jgi:type IV pilus assembly protein PilM
MRSKVAIDIGSHSIKVAEGFEKKGKLYLKALGIIENPLPNLFRNPNENEQKTFVLFLRDFLKKTGIIKKETVTGLSGESLIIHYFDIPKIPSNEIESAVQIEAMQVIPGGVLNLDYDYKVFPGTQSQTVLFVGYPKDKCSFYVETLQQSGLKTLIMDIQSVAVANCYELMQPNDSKEPTALFSVGHQYTHFIVTGQKEFLFIRDIEFGGHHLIRAMATEKKVSEAEAETYLTDPQYQDTVQQLSRTSSQEMIQEALTGIHYCEARSQLAPKTILLTGGASMLHGLKETLQQQTGIETKLWNPLTSPSVIAPSLSDDMREQGHSFTVTLGLLCRKLLQ